MIANCHLFFKKKIFFQKKCDNLGTFTQNVPFLDYNKTKQKGKKCDNLECDNLRSRTVHGALTLRALRLRFPLTLRSLRNFRKLTAKNTTKLGNS